MNFTWWFSNKIAFGKSNKKNLSKIIIRIGQLAVAIGIIVSLVTIATGVGARKGIKQKLADFNGHITIKPYNSNASFNSNAISIQQDFYPNFTKVKEIKHVQAVAIQSGVIRTKDNFNGVVLKGVGTDFDKERFNEFMVEGRLPNIQNTEVVNEVVLSTKIANELKLGVDSSFVMNFIRNDEANQKPIYRRFIISGLYKTDVKNFDDLYIIGDIKHVQKLNRWDSLTVGGFELFTDDIENLESISNKVNNNINYNLYAQTAGETFKQIDEWISIFDKNIYIILCIMLFVVAINMTMVLLILILERVHSIGLLKSFGATNWQIRKIFINYSLFIMLPGLFVGNAIALGLLFIQKYFKILTLPSENYYLSVVPVYINLNYILLLNFGALIICAIVLLLPSYLISKVSPTKAIDFR